MRNVAALDQLVDGGGADPEQASEVLDGEQIVISLRHGQSTSASAPAKCGRWKYRGSKFSQNAC